MQVNVNIKGTHVKTVSDERGNFHFTGVQDDAVLVFRYLGKKTEVPVRGRSQIKIVLYDNLVDYFFPIPDVEMLEGASITAKRNDKIDTGFGTISTDLYTGSGTVLSGDDLASKGHTSLVTALRGRVAGVTITDDGQVLIRGIISFNSSPYALLICDGIEIESLEDVEIENVENVSILKDGDIYGIKGAAGVVVITTETYLKSN